LAASIRRAQSSETHFSKFSPSSSASAAFICGRRFAGAGVAVGEKRYSPAMCIGAERRVITGDPDKRHISTSFAERQNLTMRMHMRRFTRLTNAFSKKIENHACAVALHAMYYNFVRLHQTLEVSPAMAAGVTIGSGK
jgi:hypothetical protein